MQLTRRRSGGVEDFLKDDRGAGMEAEEAPAVGSAGRGRNLARGLESGPSAYDDGIVVDDEVEPELKEDHEARLEFDSAGETGDCSESAWLCQ